MKKVFVLCVLAATATWGTYALAIGRLADVTVTNRSTGAALPVHYHRGEYWVAGVPGAKYAIDIRNASGARVLAVTSVDGVNVVSGETASTVQTGYVFGAWQRYGITGWRKGNDAVAAFEFTASHNSYAERTGRPRDVGVIGVALFRERVPVVQPVVPFPHHSRRDRYSEPHAESSAGAATPAAPAARLERESNDASMAKRAAPQAEPKLGTGHGERESSYVSHTEFERERSTPNEVIRIRYDSRENLMAMGVLPQYRTPQPTPRAFPDSPVGYVPDPPNWR